jgi:hypothetical protein
MTSTLRKLLVLHVVLGQSTSEVLLVLLLRYTMRWG